MKLIIFEKKLVDTNGILHVSIPKPIVRAKNLKKGDEAKLTLLKNGNIVIQLNQNGR